MDEKRYACRMLEGRKEVKTSFGRSRSRRGDNIKMDIMEFFGWFHLAHGRVM
jgi:hypothetical protein